MQFDYQGHSHSGGIYKITNTNNNKIYIGSAACFKNRWTQHKKELESGKHPNKHLQAAYNIDGDSPWHFTVLEVVVAETKESGKIARKAAEQVWIDKYYDNCVNCYNIKKKADVSRADIPSKDPAKTAEKLRKANTGKKHTDEAKAKMKELAKGRIIPPPSPEGLERMRQARLKSKPISEETKKKISASLMGREGHPCSEESKEKISAANTGRKKSAELCEWISANQKGRKLSPATRAKISAAHIKRRAAKAILIDN